MPAPTRQEIREFTTDGTTGVVDRPVPDPDEDMQVLSAFLREPGDGGLDDRIGVNTDTTPDNYSVEPPAKVGGLDVYSLCRSPWFPFRFWYQQIDIGWSQWGSVVEANDVATIDISALGLADPPPLLSVTLRHRPTNAVNWAVTAITKDGVSFKNWHATEDINVNLWVCVPHSIESPIATAGPFDMTLNGVGEVDQAHGLVDPQGNPLTPDAVFGFPYSAGGVVEPKGCPVMTSMPDETEIHFGNSGADTLVLRTYAQRTHSIQL